MRRFSVLDGIVQGFLENAVQIDLKFRWDASVVH